MLTPIHHSLFQPSCLAHTTPHSHHVRAEMLTPIHHSLFQPSCLAHTTPHSHHVRAEMLTPSITLCFSHHVGAEMLTFFHHSLFQPSCEDRDVNPPPIIPCFSHHVKIEMLTPHPSLLVSAIMPGTHNTTQPAATNPWAGSAGADARVPDPTTTTSTTTSAMQPSPLRQPSPSNPFTASAHNGSSPAAAYSPGQPPVDPAVQRLQGFQQGRSHSIDTGELTASARAWPRQPQTSLTQPHQSQKASLYSGPGATNFQQQNGAAAAPWPQASPVGVKGATGGSQEVDPFDVAWAAKAVNKTSPFRGKQVKQFEVQL